MPLRTTSVPSVGDPGVERTGEPDTSTPDALRVPARTTGRARRAGIMAVQAAAVGLGALAIVTWLYRLWDRSLSVPFENVYDARQVASSVRSLIDHGLFAENPALGAPFGRTRFDWPAAGELLQRAVIVMFGFVDRRYGVVMNAYYVFGFAAVAVVAFLVLRVLRFGFVVAAPIALLYAFLPYHFFHGESHLTRSAYFSAPLAALVLLSVLSFRGTLLRHPHQFPRSWSGLRRDVRWIRVGGVVGLAAVVALSETMTTVFTICALTIVAGLVAIRDRSPAVLVMAGAVALTIGIVYGAALLPNLAYWHDNGRNASAVRRIPIEQELYGLKISQLLLPIPEHRWSQLHSLQRDATDRTTIPSEGGQGLGALGALGFLGALVGVLTRGVPARSTRPVEDRGQLWRLAGLLTVVLVLLGTVSGLALLAAVGGAGQVRTWGRVVVLIAFFALLVVAMGLEIAVRWLKARGTAGLVGASLLPLAVLGFGLWDTAVPVRFDQETEAPRIQAASEFVGEIERRLPTDAAVFQLPVIPYPEYQAQYARVSDYEQMLPYLVSHDLRWSYGGNKGRPEADWQQQVDSADPAPSLAGLRGLGFDGVVLDTWQYDDGGSAAIASLERELGPADVVSSDDARWRFWDLRREAWVAGPTGAEARRAARDLVGSLVGELPADARER